MKHFATLALLFLPLFLFAQQQYRVVNTTTKFSIKDTVDQGQYQKGDTILIYEINPQGWAEVMVRGDKDYLVKAEDLELIESIVPVKTSALPLITFIFFVIGAALWVLLRKKSDLSFWIGYVTVIAVSLLEMLYFYFLDGEPYFCWPSYVGWGWTILNFILFAAMICFQIVMLYAIFAGLSHRGGVQKMPLWIGIAAWPLGIVAAVVITFVADSQNVQHYIDNAVWVFFGVQMLQLLLFFVKLRRHLLLAVLLSVVYMVGIVSLVVFIVNMFWILLVAGAMAFGLMALLGGGGSSSLGAEGPGTYLETTDSAGNKSYKKISDKTS